MCTEAISIIHHDEMSLDVNAMMRCVQGGLIRLDMIICLVKQISIKIYKYTFSRCKDSASVADHVNCSSGKVLTFKLKSRS